MNKIVTTFVYTAILLCVLISVSCNNTGKRATKEREGILQEIMSYKSRLPYSIPGTSIAITDIEAEDDVIVYTCEIGSEDWESMSLSSEVANTDRNMARVMSNVSKDAVDKFIEHGLGLKYIYKSAETGDKLLEVEMSSEKMKEIRDKVDTGEIQPYTMIELAQIELAKMEIPAQIEEGVWITDAYIEGNNIYYVATIEGELDSSDLSSSDLREMKDDIIEGVKEEGLIMFHKKEIIRENIHFIYIYKDSRGIEFARFNIGPYDLN